MKVEKKIFKLHLLETFLFFLITSFLSFILTYVYTTIIGSPKLFLNYFILGGQSSICLVVSISWNLVNRHGILSVHELEDSNNLFKKINLFLNKRFERIDLKTGGYMYVKKKKWQRFLDRFFKENIQIEVKDNQIVMNAREKLLESIEDTIIE
jgi:hypothetical protein